MKSFPIPRHLCCGLASIAIAIFPIPLEAQWSHDPNVNNAICTAPGNQLRPAIVSDGAGGAIFVWEDLRNGSTDIYAQRVNSSGILQWPVDGIPICTAAEEQTNPSLASDGAGGAIITWGDARDTTAGIQKGDIYAQRVDASGTTLWTVDGIAIGTTPDLDYEPSIIGDGATGAIILWGSQANGGINTGLTQKINALGALQLTPKTVPAPFSVMTSDGAGGAMIAGGTTDIRAQKVDASGALLWGINGVGVSSTVALRQLPRIVGDDSGGALITWEEWNTPSEPDIYAQRVNDAGAVQWAPNGIVICEAASVQSRPRIARDGAGGAIIEWADLRGDDMGDLYAQRVNASGTVQWADGGIPVSTAAEIVNPFAHDIVADGSGGAISAWWDIRDGADDIYAQKIESTGTLPWVAGGIAVSTAPGWQGLPALIADGAGGAIVVWSDLRNGNSDIYAQRIDADGHLSGNIGLPWMIFATGESTTPLFYWNALPAAEGYHFQVSADSAFASPSIVDSAITDTMFAFTVPLDPGLYFARLRGTAEEESSSWSHNIRFAVIPGESLYSGKVSKKWNILSIPYSVQDGSMLSLFPYSASQAFAYNGGYSGADSLVHGRGYWVKFGTDDFPITVGLPVEADTIQIQVGWNLIGSIATTVDVTAIATEPGGISTSPLYGYRGGYYISDSIRPGEGYWVKADQSGILILSSSASATAANRIRIVPGGEAPPPPPDAPAADRIADHPLQFALGQNYPNPFNPTTTIRYILATDSRVRLRIFNPLGQLVRTLADDEQSAGDHRMQWDAGDNPGGVYFCRIESASLTGNSPAWVQVIKMVVMK